MMNEEVGERAGRVKSAVLLDRHPLWVESIERVVEGVDVEVVGTATDFATALALLAKWRPDLFILGTDHPEWGLDVTNCVHEARACVDDLSIVVLSSRDDPEAIERSFAAGASAYVLKTSSREDLVSTIRQVVDRSVYLFSRPRPTGAMATAPQHDPWPELTKRQIEILRLVADGLSNAQVGQQLWVSEPTVKLHLSRIYEKLQVSNRTGASRWAHLHGLLADKPSAADQARPRKAGRREQPALRSPSDV
jgi:DNA-binding NarL/FixJ family response regulator